MRVPRVQACRVGGGGWRMSRPLTDRERFELARYLTEAIDAVLDPMPRYSTACDRIGHALIVIAQVYEHAYSQTDYLRETRQARAVTP